MQSPAAIPGQFNPFLTSHRHLSRTRAMRALGHRGKQHQRATCRPHGAAARRLAVCAPGNATARWQRHEVPRLSSVAAGASAPVVTADDAAVPTTPAAASAAAPSIDAAGSSHDWLSYWYPVHVSECIDASRPHAIELLGRQMVLWRDASGAWRCMEDACPHRLAPLSEGRIEPSDGTLQCSYHGWRFDGAGRCTEIPQALDEKAKAVACSSSRSCLKTYPVRVACGLIWVWPSAGPDAAARAEQHHVPVTQAMEEGWRNVHWYRRELPYSWDILAENLSDPSHLPFSHHALWPFLRRDNAAPMPFTQLVLPAGNPPAYTVARQAPLCTFQYPAGMTGGGIVSFTPPCSIVYESRGGAVITELLAVPSGPGRSLVFTAGLISSPPVTPGDLLRTAASDPKQLGMQLSRLLMQQLPVYRSHLTSNKLFDQDGIFLHMQDRLMTVRGKEAWRTAYYMPVSCDGAIIAARRWADAALQQQLPVAVGQPGALVHAADVISMPLAAAAAPRASKSDLANRYQQHTQHCTICQGALSRLQQQLGAARVAAAACLAGLAALLGGALLPRLLAAAAGVAQQPDVTAAAAGSGGLLAAAVLAVVGAAAAALAAATQKLIAQFHYVEFSHADNH